MNMNKGYIYSEQVALFGHKESIGYGKENFYVKEIPRSRAVETIKKNHYSKKVVNSSFLHLGLDNVKWYNKLWSWVISKLKQ